MCVFAKTIISITSRPHRTLREVRSSVDWPSPPPTAATHTYAYCYVIGEIDDGRRCFQSFFHYDTMMTEEPVRPAGRRGCEQERERERRRCACGTRQHSSSRDYIPEIHEESMLYVQVCTSTVSTVLSAVCPSGFLGDNDGRSYTGDCRRQYDTPFFLCGIFSPGGRFIVYFRLLIVSRRKSRSWRRKA